MVQIIHRLCFLEYWPRSGCYHYRSCVKHSCTLHDDLGLLFVSEVHLLLPSFFLQTHSLVRDCHRLWFLPNCGDWLCSIGLGRRLLQVVQLLQQIQLLRFCGLLPDFYYLVRLVDRESVHLLQLHSFCAPGWKTCRYMVSYKRQSEALFHSSR